MSGLIIDTNDQFGPPGRFLDEEYFVIDDALMMCDRN